MSRLAVYIQIAEYINEHEFFWLSEIRELLGAKNAEIYDYPVNGQISNFIKEMRNKGYVTCSGTERGERQYVRLKIIEIEIFQ